MTLLGSLGRRLTAVYQYYFQQWVDAHWNEIEHAYNISKTVALHSIVVFVVASSCLYISAFLFGAIYFYNMPTIYHSFDLNFQYNRRCIQQHRNYLERGLGLSSFYESSCFPKAFVDLGSASNSELLKPDQPYRVYVSLELPESRTNGDIGMFMVSMKCGKAFASVPATMRFRPYIIKMISTIIFWPLLLMNFAEEKQTLAITLFEEIRLGSRSKEDIQECLHEHSGVNVMKHVNCQNWVAKIEMDYPDIQVYSARLHVTAQFSGLQYFLFQWPVFSFIVGTSIFFVPVLASILVLYYIALCKPYRAVRLALTGSQDGEDVDTVEGPPEPLLTLDGDDVECTVNDTVLPDSTTSAVEVVGPSSPPTSEN